MGIDPPRLIRSSIVFPPTISYVAPSRAQVGGLCYLHAPLQTFQTRYALEVDQQGWYPWGPNELDRSLHMTPVPFYQCAGATGDVFRFLDLGGLVDQCVDEYSGEWYTENPCGYYGRYMGLDLSGLSGCSPLQQQSTGLLNSRSDGWTLDSPIPDDPVGTWVEHVADLIRFQGPVSCAFPRVAHEMSVVGYDLRMPQDPVLCYQNSGRDGDPVYCLSRSEFEESNSRGRCTVAHYPESVQYPLLMAYGTPAFNTWWLAAAEDKNVDGIPDSVALDADGDGAFDIYDHDPRNPYLRIDTDNDTYGEPRLDGMSVLSTVENCLAWCTSLEQLSGYSGDNEGGGQGCRDRCNNFDRCITGSIKNIGDNQCDWSCLSTRGRDRNGDHIIEPNEICDPDPSHPEWDYCCYSDELQLLDDVCGPLYHNVSNEDSDREFGQEGGEGSDQSNRPTPISGTGSTT